MRIMLVCLVLCLIIFMGCTSLSVGDSVQETIEQEEVNISTSIIDAGDDLSGIITDI